MIDPFDQLSATLDTFAIEILARRVMVRMYGEDSEVVKAKDFKLASAAAAWLGKNVVFDSEGGEA